MRKIIPYQTTNSQEIYEKGIVADQKYLQSLIEECFARIVSENVYHPKIRIFKDFGTRDDYPEKLYASEFSLNGDLEKTLDKIFGDNYCIAINNISGWSEELRAYLYENFIHYWLEKYGCSFGGIDTYVFVGRYTITPFGIHKDDEDTFLFNLGPWHWFVKERQTKSHAASRVQ
jgi:hypothetical protein